MECARETREGERRRGREKNGAREEWGEKKGREEGGGETVLWWFAPGQHDRPLEDEVVADAPEARVRRLPQLERDLDAR